MQPGERWTEGVSDASGNLYIFGGNVNTSTGSRARNDLWKYDISSNQWTWIGGTQATNSTGSYGTQGVFSSTSVPLGRYGHVLWIDSNNKLWLFGGEYLNLSGLNWLNDTWCFDINTGQWAWMKGSNTFYNMPLSTSGAVYGTQSVPAASNTPGWRASAPYWPGDPATLWIYSGSEWIASTELWRFSGCTSVSTVSVSSSNATLCAGATATLTASGSAATFSWNTGALTNTIAVSPSITSIYYAIDSGTTNCSVGSAITIFVQSLSVSVMSSSGVLCSGQNATLTASGALTYTWSGAQTGSLITITPQITTIYTVSGFINGCSTSKSFTQVVSPTPVVSISSSSSVICVGSSIMLTTAGAVSYSWNNGQTAASFSASPLSTAVYTVTGSTNGCTSSASYTQTVNPNPVLNISSSPTVTCSGNSVFLNVSGAVSYNWNNGQTASSFSNSPLSTTVYSVSGTTNGCTSSASYTQIVNPNPVLNVSSSPSVTCSGNPLFINVSGAVSYNWNSGQTTASFSVSPLSTTIYTVTGTTNGCSTTRSFTQQVLPLPNIHVNGPANAICMREATMLIVSGANTYTWSLQGLTTPVIQVSPALTTTYAVIGTDNSGCKALAAVTVTVLNCTDFREYAGEENYFSVYPNPASTPFTIRTAGVGILKVINSLGQLVLEQKLESETIVIHDRLLPGIYYCTINGIGKTLKLLIQD